VLRNDSVTDPNLKLTAAADAVVHGADTTLVRQ